MHIFLIPFCFGQDMPNWTKFIKEIVSTEFENSDTANHRIVHTFYDSAMNVLSNENTLASALREGSKSVVIVNTPIRYVKGEITRTDLEKRMLEKTLQHEYAKPLSGEPFKINEKFW